MSDPQQHPGKSQQQERRTVLTELFGSGGDTVWMQPPVLLRLRHEHTSRDAGLLQLQLHRARCLRGKDRRLHAVRFGVRSTPLHPTNAALRRQQELGKPIEVGADVWVGAGALILAGVRIGSRSVIGAGSIVTRDIPADVFAVGQSRRVIREIAD